MFAKETIIIRSLPLPFDWVRFRQEMCFQGIKLVIEQVVWLLSSLNRFQLTGFNWGQLFLIVGMKMEQIILKKMNLEMNQKMEHK